MQKIETIYLQMIENGATPQEVRSVLPNSLKIEIVVSMYLCEWRYFFKLRTSEHTLKILILLNKLFCISDYLVKRSVFI